MLKPANKLIPLVIALSLSSADKAQSKIEAPELFAKTTPKISQVQISTNHNIHNIILAKNTENHHLKLDQGLIFPNTPMLDYSKNNRKIIETYYPNQNIYIINDHLTNFYRVQSGDTIAKIRHKLSQIPQYNYLNKLSRLRYKSFNIRSKYLKTGMLLPIPQTLQSRLITPQEFFNTAQTAITIMSQHPKYGTTLQHYLNTHNPQDLLKIMFAIANHESKLGQTVLHSFEEKTGVFSYSIYQIMNKEAGKNARQKLGFTNGELSDPLKSSQLFIAFLIEKGWGKKGSKNADFFANINNPDNQIRLSKFYNGNNASPQYIKGIEQGLLTASKILSSSPLITHTNPLPQRILLASNSNQIPHITHPHKPQPQKSHLHQIPPYPQELQKSYQQAPSLLKTLPIQTKSLNSLSPRQAIGQRTLYHAIRDYPNFHLNEHQVGNLALIITRHLQKLNHSSNYFPTDQISITKTKQGPQIHFHRPHQIRLNL